MYLKNSGSMSWIDGLYTLTTLSKESSMWTFCFLRNISYELKSLAREVLIVHKYWTLSGKKFFSHLLKSTFDNFFKTLFSLKVTEDHHWNLPLNIYTVKFILLQVFLHFLALPSLRSRCKVLALHRNEGGFCSWCALNFKV